MRETLVPLFVVFCYTKQFLILTGQATSALRNVVEAREGLHAWFQTCFSCGTVTRGLSGSAGRSLTGSGSFTGVVCIL
jgi:hypothetical protein